MTKKTMQFLSEGLNNLGIEHECRENYSGRYMYGTTTCGIVLDNVTNLICAVASACDCGHVVPEDLLDNDEGFNTDSMGMSTIVY